jgi:hypothetical protein
MDNYLDNFDYHSDDKKKTRPLGVTILAILQIIGIIILIFILIVIPLIYDESINGLIGFSIIEFFIIYSLILIPVSVLLAYGLLTGKEWARFTSILLQISSIISSVIRMNIFGVIFPIIIINYLYKSHVKDYFKTEKGIKNNIKAMIIIGIVFLIIINGYIALSINPQTDREFGRIPDNSLYGTWENVTKNIEISFYSNNSFFISKENVTYWGTWDITSDVFAKLKLNWEDGTGRYDPLFLDKNNVIIVYVEGKSGFFSLIDLKKKI